jgi:hypothetical protein
MTNQAQKLDRGNMESEMTGAGEGVTMFFLLDAEVMLCTE